MLSGCAHACEITEITEITRDRPTQPGYRIKPMLSRVARALARIFCVSTEGLMGLPIGDQ